MVTFVVPYLKVQILTRKRIHSVILDIDFYVRFRINLFHKMHLDGN